GRALFGDGALAAISGIVLGEYEMRKGTWWRWLVGLFVVGLVVAGVFIVRGRAAKGAPIDPTLLAKVSRGELEIAVVELGKIEPREKVGIKSKVAGQVEKVLVDEGMKVKQ